MEQQEKEEERGDLRTVSPSCSELLGAVRAAKRGTRVHVGPRQRRVALPDVHSLSEQLADWLTD